MRWERHTGARWDRDFDAKLSLNFFTKVIGNHEKCLRAYFQISML